eukprot:2187820-Pyramimonas_sp.AAC.1
MVAGLAGGLRASSALGELQESFEETQRRKGRGSSSETNRAALQRSTPCWPELREDPRPGEEVRTRVRLEPSSKFKAKPAGKRKAKKASKRGGRAQE